MLRQEKIQELLKSMQPAPSAGNHKPSAQQEGVVLLVTLPLLLTSSHFCGCWGLVFPGCLWHWLWAVKL